jgi:hypothetical protein
MGTPTARTAVLKPDPTDIVNVVTQIDAAFDKFDLSLGYILVNDGVTPPNSVLYDGAVVKEKTSGYTWVAQWNGTSYDKKLSGVGPWVRGTNGPTNINSGSGGVWFRKVDNDVEVVGTIGPNAGTFTGNPVLVTYPTGYDPVYPSGSPPYSGNGSAWLLPCNVTARSSYIIARIQGGGFTLLGSSGMAAGDQYDFAPIRYPWA